MEAALVIEGLEGIVAAHRLSGDSITIGRTPGNGVVLDDRSVSKAHARLTLAGGQYVLSDLRSRNGTRVNGVKIREHRLAFGDRIQIGSVRLRYVMADESIDRLAGATGAMPEAARADVPPTSEADNGALALTDRVAASELDLLDLQGGGSGGIPLARVELLDELARAVCIADGELAVLDEVAPMLAALLRCRLATIVVFDEGTSEPILFSTSAGGQGGGARQKEPSRRLSAIAIATERPTCVVADGVGLDDGRAPESVSCRVLVVPLRGPAGKLGYVSLERDLGGPPFSDADHHLGSIAAGLVATYLKRAVGV